MTSFLASLWGKVLGAAAIAGAVLLAVFKVRQSGRQAERAEATEKGVAAIARANQAAKAVDPSQKAIDSDENNLDR